MEFKVGDKVYLSSESRSYKIMARDERFIICVKPFNLYKTYFYFIIDLEISFKSTKGCIHSEWFFCIC